MKRAKIAVVGSINMDLVVQTNKRPAVGETVMGERFAAIPGGKGANQAVAAARLGADVAMVGCVGNDLYGNTLLEHFRAEGLDTSQIGVVPDASTGVAVIQVGSDGDNSIIVVSGANAAVTRETVMSSADVIRQADVLLVQLEIPLDAVEAALGIAHSHGVITVLNPAPAMPLSPQLLEKVRLLTPNETEAALLTGTALGADIAETYAAAKRLLPQGNVILTLGSQGAWFEAADGFRHVPACRVDAVDTTAAGDCFNAAVAVSLGEGKSLEEAVRFAVRAAAVSVTRFGAQPSLPFREEVERLGQA